MPSAILVSAQSQSRFLELRRTLGRFNEIDGINATRAHSFARTLRMSLTDGLHSRWTRKRKMPTLRERLVMTQRQSLVASNRVSHDTIAHTRVLELTPSHRNVVSNVVLTALCVATLLCVSDALAAGNGTFGGGRGDGGSGAGKGASVAPPSMQPGFQPGSQPGVQPGSQPRSAPKGQPSAQPSGQPNMKPSGAPSVSPNSAPRVTSPTTPRQSSPTATPAPRNVDRAPIARPAAPAPSTPTPRVSQPRKPDVRIPETRKPDVRVPETRKPDVRVPETRKPDVRVPETRKPDVRIPETRKPDVRVPETRKPEVRIPETRKPEVRVPETRKPEVRKPDARKPIVEIPGARPTGTGNNIGRKPITLSEPNAARPVTKRPPQFVSGTVHGVPVEPRQRSGGGNQNNNKDKYNTQSQYVNSVSYNNGWWRGSNWSSCGPCDVWQPYNCSNGSSISIGFGSGGFGFGFFYGSSSAPFCSSWNNPWWDGYATSWNCAPAPCGWQSWRNPCWGASYWNGYRPWWNSYYGCGPCPLPMWTPVYTYAPVVYAPVVYTPIVYSSVVYAPAPIVVTPVATLPSPSALWTFLAQGYDGDAESGFIALSNVDPLEGEWLVGQGFARAFRGDTALAANTMRQAFAADPSAFMRTTTDARFGARLDSLELTLAPAAQSSPASVDALVVIAASQAARGDLAAAYFSITSAQTDGDLSPGTAAFARWLNLELRRRP